MERGVSKKSRKKRLSCNHRGFTFSAKKTEIGDKKKKVEKKGEPGRNTFGTFLGGNGPENTPDVFRHDNCEQLGT